MTLKVGCWCSQGVVLKHTKKLAHREEFSGFFFSSEETDQRMSEKKSQENIRRQKPGTSKETRERISPTTSTGARVGLNEMYMNSDGLVLSGKKELELKDRKGKLNQILLKSC